MLTSKPTVRQVKCTPANAFPLPKQTAKRPNVVVTKSPISPTPVVRTVRTFDLISFILLVFPFAAALAAFIWVGSGGEHFAVCLVAAFFAHLFATFVGTVVIGLGCVVVLKWREIIALSCLMTFLWLVLLVVRNCAPPG
jgi:hypothetical protein